MVKIENLLSEIQNTSGWRFLPDTEGVWLAVIRIEGQIIFVTTNVSETINTIRFAMQITPPVYGGLASVETICRYALNLNSTLTLGHLSLYKTEAGEEFLYSLSIPLDKTDTKYLRESLDYVAWVGERLKKRFHNIGRALGLKFAPSTGEKLLNFFRGRTGKLMTVQQILEKEQDEKSLPKEEPKLLT